MNLLSQSIVKRIFAGTIILFHIIPVRADSVKGNGFNYLPDYVAFENHGNSLAIANNGKCMNIYVDPSDWDGVKIATENLAGDLLKVASVKPGLKEMKEWPSSGIYSRYAR